MTSPTPRPTIWGPADFGDPAEGLKPGVLAVVTEPEWSAGVDLRPGDVCRLFKHWRITNLDWDEEEDAWEVFQGASEPRGCSTLTLCTLRLLTADEQAALALGGEAAVRALFEEQ